MLQNSDSACIYHGVDDQLKSETIVGVQWIQIFRIWLDSDQIQARFRPDPETLDPVWSSQVDCLALHYLT